MADNEVQVLYIASQGGSAYDGTLNSGQGYGIWTSTSADLGSSRGDRYQADLKDGSLGIAIANDSLDSATGNPRVSAHYMVLAPFIGKYHWDFRNGSLVALGISSSDPDELGAMSVAIRNAGCKSILGWTGALYADMAYYCNSYCLDQSLGANAIEGTTPPRRSFGLASCLSVLVARHLATYKNYLGKECSLAIEKPEESKVYQAAGSVITSSQEEFQILRPSIKEVSIGDDNTLILDGDFPPQVGNINFKPPQGFLPPTQAGQPAFPTASSFSLNILQIRDGKITCGFLPSSMGIQVVNGVVQQGRNGRMAIVGEISVSSLPILGGEALDSNSREISRWQGQVTDTRKIAGTAIQKAICTVSLRGDVGPIWKSPDGPLSPNDGFVEWDETDSNTYFYMPKMDSDCSCQVQLLGEAKFPDGMLVQYAYTGPSRLKAFKSVRDSSYFQCDLGIPSKDGGLGRLRFLALSNNSLTTVITQPNGSRTEAVGSERFQTLRDDGGDQYNDAVVQLHHFDVLPGSQKISPSETIEWTAFPCQCPPDLQRE